MYQLILLIHVFVAVFLVALILVQQGKGATVGAAFGSGASQTIFGSRGSGSFLFRVTMSFVTVFFVTSITLNYLTVRATKQEKVITLPIVPPVPQKSVTAPGSVPSVPGITPVLPSEIPVRKE